MEIKVEHIDNNDCKNHRRQVIDIIARNCKAIGINTDKTQKMLKVGKFIDHIYQTENKAIISAPCGGGKSHWSDANIIHCTKVWDNPQTPIEFIPKNIYVVVDSVKTAEARIENLIKLGVNARYLGIYHSHNAEECRRLSGKEHTYNEIRKPENRHICKNCIGRDECKYCNKYSELSKNAVFMCHEGFCRLHEKGVIPPDRDIIVDEEIVNFFYSIFRRHELEAFLKHVPDDCSEFIIAVKRIITELLAMMDSKDGRNASHEWVMRLSKDTKDSAIEDLYEASQSSEDMDLDLYADHYKDLIYKLGYALPEDLDVYVWAEENDITVGRNRINFQIPNRTILLNGSAQLARNIYNQPEMRIWCCPDVEEYYDNVTLNCLPLNPTKKKLKNPDHIKELLDYAQEVFKGCKEGSGIFFAINKVNPEMEDIIGELFPCVEARDKGYRGSIIGRNDWRDYDNGVMGSSLFTNLGIYTLSASLRNGREYEQAEIFHKVSKGGDSRLSPRFTKNFHIANLDIDEEFQRNAVFELHQYIMRLSCRHQTKESVRVVALIPNIDMILLLHKLMPGFKVESPDPMLKLANHLLNSEEAIRNDEIYERFGLVKCGPAMKKIAGIMKDYGWILTKLKGERGNVKVWVKQVEDDAADDNTLQVLGLD